MVFEIRYSVTSEDKSMGSRPSEEDIRILVKLSHQYRCLCRLSWKEEYTEEKFFGKKVPREEQIQFIICPTESEEDVIKRFIDTIVEYDEEFDDNYLDDDDDVDNIQ